MKIKRSLATLAGSALIVGSLAFAGPAVAQSSSFVDRMNAMHYSPAMQQMREGMPDDLQALCDEMHARMTSETQPDGTPTSMMGSGGGMMGF